MRRLAWSVLLALMILGPAPSSASADERLVKTLQAQIELQEALIKELRAQIEAFQSMYEQTSAMHDRLIEQVKGSLDASRSYRQTIDKMYKDAARQAAEIARLTSGRDAERSAVSALLAGMGTAAVPSMARALETAPAACAPIVCPALEALGIEALAAVPALTRVRENTEGESSHLAGRALFEITRAVAPDAKKK